LSCHDTGRRGGIGWVRRFDVNTMLDWAASSKVDRVTEPAVTSKVCEVPVEVDDT
jgi:hypothetical protein